MIFQEFVNAQPLISIIVFSLIITFVLTWLSKLLINQDKMKELKERTKQLQQNMKEEKNPDKLAQFQKEMLQISGEQMKMSFKPMLITYLPLILFWVFLKGLYTKAGVGDLIHWGVSLPIIGTGAGWLLSYLIFCIIFSIILRKLMKVQ